MTEETGQEVQKRRDKRFKVNWASRISLPDKRIIPARIRDISAGGVGFELDEAVAVGSSINMELKPWSGGRQFAIRAKCVITYSMLMSGNLGFSHGVRFDYVPPEQLATLKKILKAME